MSATHQQWTIDSYLAFERASEERHEFVDGEVRPMARSRQSQSLTIGNIATTLNLQLRPNPDTVYAVQMRIRAGNSYLYPDVLVVRGKAITEDTEHDTILNPVIIVEVLLPSTEAYDRGRKFQHYREIVSLGEYILISQEEYRVERYLRNANDEWVLTDARGIDAVLDLPSVGCTLSLADIYDKVEFEPPERSE